MQPAFITVIGQYMGAGKTDGAEYYLKKLVRIAWVFGGGRSNWRLQQKCGLKKSAVSGKSPKDVKLSDLPEDFYELPRKHIGLKDDAIIYCKTINDRPDHIETAEMFNGYILTFTNCGKNPFINEEAKKPQALSLL